MITNKQIHVEDIDFKQKYDVLSPQVGAFGDYTQSTTSVTAGKSKLTVEDAFDRSFTNTEDMYSNENNLRLPSKKNYAGDRFIPLRSQGLNEQNYEL